MPQYIDLQNSSDWVTTALLCAGLESSTLPTRFNANAGNPTSLSLLEATLNINGARNLFELHASLKSLTSETNGNVSGTVPERSRLDLDYSPTLSDLSAAGSMHVFAQVECERDVPGSDVRSLALSPDERLRRRLDDDSVVEM